MSTFKNISGTYQC